MASLNGFFGSVSGTTGTANTIEPKSGWRAYLLPRGAHASAASSGGTITLDSADAASRFPDLSWIQVGTDTSKIRGVVNKTSNVLNLNTVVTTAINDRILLIGSTQPTVTGGSASYQPNTTVYPRDDNGSTPVANSVVTTSSDGFYQFWAADAQYDILVQDSNRSNAGIIPDVQIGIQPTSNFTPLTSAAVSLGTCPLPFNELVLAGKWISGVTSAAGRTYFDFRTCNGVTQGNLFAFGISNQAPKIYGDTWGGVFQSWTLPQVFNVKSAKYGAKGDNSTDDTAAIAAALTDAAASVSGASGGVVFLPPGTYIVNSQLVVPTKVKLVGSGRSATVIKAGGSFTFNGTTDSVVRLGTASENAHGTWLEELSVDCNDIAGSIAVYSTRVNEPSGLYRVTIVRPRLYGVFFSGGTCSNFVIRDCEFYCSDSIASTYIGINLSATVGVGVIDRVTMASYSGADLANGIGIYLGGDAGWSIRLSNIYIETNDIGVRHVTGHASITNVTGLYCRVLYDRASGAGDIVATSLTGLLSVVGFSDAVTGFTSASMGIYTNIDSGQNRMALGPFHATGLTWAISYPTTWTGVHNHSGTVNSTGTVIDAPITTLTAGTAITLPAGNLFGVSTSPAGATTVTSFVTVNNGRRIKFLGQAGTLTINSGNNIWTPGGTNKTLNVKDVAEFECVGTTWILLANPTAVS